MESYLINQAWYLKNFQIETIYFRSFLSAWKKLKATLDIINKIIENFMFNEAISFKIANKSHFILYKT